MSFEVLRPAGGRDMRVATVAAYNRGKNAVQLEIKFSAHVARFLGVKNRDTVALGIGRGEDEGKYVLAPNPDGNRVRERNGYYYVRFSVTYVRIPPFSVRPLEILTSETDKDPMVVFKEVA